MNNALLKGWYHIGKTIKGYESTNFGKNIHIDNSPCIVYYKYMEKSYNDTTGRNFTYGAFNFGKNVKHLRK